MTIQYVAWQDVKSIQLRGATLFSIDPSPKIQQAGRQLVDVYFNNYEQATNQFNLLKQVVLSEIKNLLDSPNQEDALINDLLVEIEWIIEEAVKDEQPYVEAQVMTYIVLLSSRIAFLALNNNIELRWLDSRDVAVTDDNWMEAKIQTEVSHQKVLSLNQDATYITSHGIGCTSDNQNTITQIPRYWALILS